MYRTPWLPTTPLPRWPSPLPVWHYIVVLAGWAYAALPRRARHLLRSEAGMTTAEYAVGTIAAAALAAVLYVVVTGDNVVNELESLVKRALSVDF